LQLASFASFSKPHECKADFTPTGILVARVRGLRLDGIGEIMGSGQLGV
jgi:hypothetical protein